MPHIIDDGFQSTIDFRLKELMEDEERYGYLDQPGILAYLNKLGFSATKTTLSRYSQLGLMMLPENKRKRSEGQGRTFYNPLAVIEYMAAFLLFKGSWKVIESKDLRVPRFTADDLFFGRLLYFRDNNFPEEVKEIGYEKYRIDISSNKQVVVSENCFRDKCSQMGEGIIQMSDIKKLDLIDFSLSHYIKRYNIDGVESIKFGEAYSVYNHLIYKMTFNSLFEQHKKEILNGHVFSELIL